MKDNEEIVVEFIHAWSRLDVDELVSFFTEDAIYHNIPVDPVSGKKTIEAFIKSFISTWAETRWEILNVVSKENLVITERIDRTKMTGGGSVDLPVVGVFEMEDGKIKAWRDYFDMNTYLKALE